MSSVSAAELQERKEHTPKEVRTSDKAAANSRCVRRRFGRVAGRRCGKGMPHVRVSNPPAHATHARTHTRTQNPEYRKLRPAGRRIGAILDAAKAAAEDDTDPYEGEDPYCKVAGGGGRLEESVCCV